MSEPVNFDLNTFQSKVIQEYDFLKSMKKLNSQYFENPYGKYANFSEKQNFVNKLIWIAAFKIIGCLEKKALHAYSEQADITEYEKKSKDIIFHPKIKKILCSALDKKMTPDLLGEEKDIRVIKIVTSSLTKESIVEDLPIDLDAKLFAFMVHGILQESIKNYCQNHSV